VPRRSAPSKAFWLVFAAGAAYRAAFLGDPFRLDEVYTALYYASRPAAEIASTYVNANNHFLLSLLLRAVYLAVGFSELAFRLPVFLCGLATIWLGYELARRATGNERTALLTAGLIAFSQPLVLYSVNARGYALQIALAQAAALLFVFGPKLRASARIAGLAAAGFLILYSVPTGLVFLAGLYLFLAFDAHRGRSDASETLLAGAATAGLAGLALLPLLINLPAVASLTQRDLERGGSLTTLASALGFMSDGLLPPLLMAAALAAGLLAGFRERRTAVFFSCVVLGWPAAALVLSPFAPSAVFFARSYCILFPFAYAAAAAGIVACWDARRPAAKALAAGLSAALLASAVGGLVSAAADPNALYYPERTYRRDCGLLVRSLADKLVPGTRVAGTDDDSDGMAAYHAIALKGFKGNYGLYALDRAGIRRIYLLGRDARSVERFYRESLDPRAWSKPRPAGRSGSASAFETDRLPG
jgi:hypothetical protein